MVKSTFALSALLTLLFIILSLPYTYGLSNSLIPNPQYATQELGGTPTVTGVLLHASLFGILTLAILLTSSQQPDTEPQKMNSDSSRVNIKDTDKFTEIGL